jgi:hypothetical protein
VSDESSPAAAARAREQRAALNAAKLAALVRDRWGVDAPRTMLDMGAAMTDGERAFLLLEGDVGLGAALAWSRRFGAHEVHLIADDDPGALARQAAEFRTDVSVWRTEGRDLVAVEPSSVDVGQGPPDSPDLVALLESHGLDVVVEGDRLSGELRGLEVVRIVRALDNAEPILEVGVGRFDRELTAMMHGDLPGAESLTRVVEQLRDLRRPSGPNHPLARLVPERWLRSTLVHEPGRIGCDRLEPAPTPIPRDRLRDRAIAAATGARRGEPVVVACSVGVHLDAIAAAADTRLALDPDATLLLALPERDVLPVTRAMVDDLVRPAEIAPVGGDWKT